MPRLQGLGCRAASAHERNAAAPCSAAQSAAQRCAPYAAARRLPAVVRAPRTRPERATRPAARGTYANGRARPRFSSNRVFAALSPMRNLTPRQLPAQPQLRRRAPAASAGRHPGGAAIVGHTVTPAPLLARHIHPAHVGMHAASTRAVCSLTAPPEGLFSHTALRSNCRWIPRRHTWSHEISCCTATTGAVQSPFCRAPSLPWRRPEVIWVLRRCGAGAWCTSGSKSMRRRRSC